MNRLPRRVMLPFFLFVLCAAGACPLQAAPENVVVETRLPNGLVVLTKEVHSAPVVEVMVFYKVGSRNEGVGQTGMSHLLEHMLFKGTTTLKPGDIDRAFDRVGAEINAYTTDDLTVYHETLARDNLPLALKIEADRMVNSVFDPAEHKREMTVVRSELEGDENSPDSLLYTAVMATAFQAHPYRWPVLGWRADVENVSRDEMFAYYRNYYVPNNAILVLVGDFDTNKAMALVRRHFGKIPARPVRKRYITPEPPQRGERRVVVRREGTTPRVLIGYRIPRFGHPDYYALDVISTVLSGGRSARLFQALVETGTAAEAYATNPDHTDPYLMLLGATAQQKKTAPDLEKALLSEVEKLQKGPVSDAELARARNQIEASFVFERDSIPAQADVLGRYAVRGDWRYTEKYLPLIRRVTAADVQRVARKYLTPDTRTVGHYVPIPPAAASPASAAKAGPASRARRHRRSRAAGPRPGGATATAGPGVRAAKTTRTVLPNGLTVIVRENHANPTVSLAGSILSAGDAADPPGKPGVASFTADMLERGTRNRTSKQIAETLEEVGASLDVSAGSEYLSFGGRSLTKDFGRLIDVLADELRRPAFPADQLNKLRAEALSGLEQEAEDPSARAMRAFHGAVFPPDHPYWSPTVDAERDFIRRLKREDLIAFHGTHYGPNTMILVIVGDVDTPATIERIRQNFGDWARKEGLAVPIIPPTRRQSRPARIVIPIPDKSQVDIVYGYAGGQRRNAPDFYATQVLNWILGGGTFGSRLMTDLRDKQGLVYGAYSSVAANLGEGPFLVSLGTNPANADRAVSEVRRHIARLRTQGVTEEEVARAKSYIIGSYPRELATNAGMAGELLEAQIFGLGLDYPARQGALYRAVTREQVNAAAKRYLEPQGGTLVLAGPYPGAASGAAGAQPGKPQEGSK